ncbi:MAG: hypothetical protein H6817_10935 [Phycisphaerales bacterium]|nr:hypothetical protein [Phycisphaerales bacterium]
MNKDRPLLPLLRMATRVHRGLERNRPVEGHSQALDRVAACAQAINAVARRLRLCNSHQWYAAEITERQGLEVRIRDLEHALNSLKEELTRPAKRTPVLRDVFEDLRELEAEFGEVRLDSTHRFVAVTTESIVLQEIELGRFELQIDVSMRPGAFPSEALRAVALDPNPCAADDAITHPHVSSERVCLGDAAVPFGAALGAGRLADAMLIARAVLETYNDGSPYCLLDSWYGRACSDCGRIENVDDTCWCERCEQEFCGECFGSCAGCGDSSCCGCLNTCPLCDESMCSGCLESCTHCNEPACTSCLEDGLCPTCVEAELDEENEDDEAIETPSEDQQPIRIEYEEESVPEAVTALAG